MLEWGQPLHAFDYDVLVQRAGGKAPTIIVRPARAGEMLDDARRAGARADAGEPASSPTRRARSRWPASWAGRRPRSRRQTTNILLESANFDFVSIRRTMKQFNLPSEASVRFSRAFIRRRCSPPPSAPPS